MATSLQQWQFLPGMPPERNSWCRRHRMNTGQTSCCRPLMHAISIKNELRQLYAIGSVTQSSVLYSVGEGNVSQLMPANFIVAALRRCQ